MKVVVLHDRLSPSARADELDGMVQVRACCDALGRLGGHAEVLAFDLDLSRAADELRRRSPDVVFNLVESVEGAGRLIHLAPALLESLGIAYTGAPSDALYVTSNKLLTKQWLAAAGLPTPAWVALDREQVATGELAPSRAEPFGPGRYIVKSVWEDASLGLDSDSVVSAEAPEHLHREIETRRERLGGEAFAEAFVDGREFNLSLLADGEGVSVLPAAEIRFEGFPPDRPCIVDYKAKWDETSFEYQHTVRGFDFAATDAALLAELATLARRTWDLFGLSGYARVDFRVDRLGRPWILEINANPCLSPDAGFMAAAERAGLAFDEVIARLLRQATRASGPAPSPAQNGEPPSEAEMVGGDANRLSPARV